MEIKIVRNEDPKLIAMLNHDVQKIHNEIEPEIFKPFCLERMTNLFSQLLVEPSISAYVAYADETPAGYILLCQKKVDENDLMYGYSALHIEQICVDNSFRMQGIGKLLVDFAKQFAKDSQIKHLEMNYFTKNQNSGEFFRHQGFVNFIERMTFKID